MKFKILIAGALIVLALAVALPLRNVLANGSLPFGVSQSHVTSQQAGATATPPSPNTPANCPTDTPDQPETKSATDTDQVDQQCGDQNGPDEANGTPEAQGTPEANEGSEQHKTGNQVKTKDANEQGETNDATEQGGTENGQPNSGTQLPSQSQ